jgi:hypothetical protein
MYIPEWMLIGIAVFLFILFRSRRKGTSAEEVAPSVVEFEECAERKKASVFSLEHFDSPRFVDLQNASDAMETNYLRLKQRLYHDKDKALELAEDWLRYVSALDGLKHARRWLDLDDSDGARDTYDEQTKEPKITKEEVEMKFESLLGADWQDLPPDYDERMRTMEKPDEEGKQGLGYYHRWKHYYQDDDNLVRLEEERAKKATGGESGQKSDEG